ncbi:MAG TPA: hypothetical protein VM925_09335 [Labilithrix sp.]|nr:hypothetical protein [Labilithrix sp.]
MNRTGSLRANLVGGFELLRDRVHFASAGWPGYTIAWRSVT